MTDPVPKLTVEELITYACEHMAGRPAGTPMVATFVRKCPCSTPNCNLEFLINVVPIDNVIYSVSPPERIH